MVRRMHVRWFAVAMVTFAMGAGCVLADSSRIALEVLEPEGRAAVRDFPIAVGVVVPAGTLTTVPGGRVVDDRGQNIPILAEVTGWWDEARTDPKWVLLRFRADTDRQYFFEPGSESAKLLGDTMVSQDGDAVVIDTGPLRTTLTPQVGLIRELLLNGKPMVQPHSLRSTVSIDFGKSAKATSISGWQLNVVENTPLRAVVDAQADCMFSQGADFTHRIAQVKLRLEFHKGESFIRVYHTFLWLSMNPVAGVRELSLAFKPLLGEGGNVSVGNTWEGQWDRQSTVIAQQSTAEAFTVKQGKDVVEEGEHLSGALHITGETSGGGGVGVSLRHAWQMYPTALGVDKGLVDIQLWPRTGDAMAFTPLAIQGKEIYYHPVWKIRPYADQEEHFVHERARFSWFPHAPQGAARTCEMTLFFHDETSRRTADELHAVTTEPVVLRQDPASAMKVPFMGFRLSPRMADDFADIERAIETLGKYATSRWAKINDYGYWRFGFMKWGVPYPGDGGRSLYRWMDGAQYDQQLIPWLLFLRGGGREWLEEAQVVGRFLMDVGVRHYDERGFPTGYMATAGGTPFPYVPFHLTKGTKVHFLSYDHHLTGYARAREVMDEVIEGAMATAAKPEGDVPSWYYRTGGRECYNSNVFLANAWEETFDPRVKRLAQEYMQLAGVREYSEKLNTFRPPQVYMYNGLIIQQRLWQDQSARDNMLRHLREAMLGAYDTGGIDDVAYNIALQWANDHAPDKRWAQLAWDVARSQADTVPHVDFNGDMPPPFALNGNGNYREFLLPILVGLTMARDHHLTNDTPLVRNDTFVESGSLHLRARAEGDLPVKIILHTRNIEGLSLRVLDAAGKVIAEPTITPGDRLTDVLEGPGYGVQKIIRPHASFVISAAKAGHAYRVTIDGMRERDCARVIADADVVHEVEPGAMFMVTDEAGQTTAGNRFVVRSDAEVIQMWTKSPVRSPYTLRDAQTGELLFRSNARDASDQSHEVGMGRLLLITCGGYGPWTQRKITGVEPYIASTAGRWFAP